MSDAEHELLWSGAGDAILAGQASNALQPSVDASRTYTVQAGKALVAGHVVSTDGAVTGTLASNGGSADRIDLIVFRIDKTVSPWNKNITVRQGTPGAGAPSPQQDRAGVYEFVLGTATVNPSGSATLTADNRVFQSRRDMDTGEVAVSATGLWTEDTPIRVQLRNGWVYLRGSVTRTGNTLRTTDVSSPVLAAMPPLFRPSRLVFSSVMSTGGGSGQLTVGTDGTVAYSSQSKDISVGQHIWFSFMWPAA